MRSARVLKGSIEVSSKWQLWSTAVSNHVQVYVNRNEFLALLGNPQISQPQVEELTKSANVVQQEWTRKIVQQKKQQKGDEIKSLFSVLQNSRNKNDKE